jgi:transcriptional regulator with XRE-family HTH domain
MLVTSNSPADITLALARRIRDRRLDRGWTQAELAARSAVALDTLKKFEHTGQLSLPRLARLAVALGCSAEIEGLFREPAPQSLDDLTRSRRQRGRALRRTAESK